MLITTREKIEFEIKMHDLEEKILMGMLVFFLLSIIIVGIIQFIYSK